MHIFEVGVPDVSSAVGYDIFTFKRVHKIYESKKKKKIYIYIYIYIYSPLKSGKKVSPMVACF